MGGIPHVPPTVASRLVAEGRNVVQVQRFLGHHSPSFTLDTYVHLLEPGDLGGPLTPAECEQGANMPTANGDIVFAVPVLGSLLDSEQHLALHEEVRQLEQHRVGHADQALG